MGPAVESMYRLVLWLVPTVEKFPRRQKFLLGDRLEECSLTCFIFPDETGDISDVEFGGIADALEISDANFG